jgi:hypothetical protein
MATYYFRNSGTDWNTAANWSLTDGGTASGTVPLATDNAYFTSNSANCSTSANANAVMLLFSGVGTGNYNKTFTLNNTLTLSGTFSLSSTMIATGSGTVSLTGTQRLTSNGCVWNPNVQMSGNVTKTFGDSWTINGTLMGGGGGATSHTLSGLTSSLIINLKGNLVVNTTSTAFNGGVNPPTIIMNGTGAQTWSALLNGIVRSPLTISNSNAVVSGTVNFDSSTLTTTTNVITAGSTLVCPSSVATTLNIGSCTWSNVSLLGTTTYTIGSSLNISGTFSLGSTNVTTALALGSNNINLKGNLYLNITSGTITQTGTGSIIMNGTASQIWSQPGQTSLGSLRINLTINNPNTIISGTVGYSVGTLTALTTATTSGSTLLCVGACTLNASLINWNNVTMNSAVTYTLGSDLYLSGTFRAGAGAGTNTTLSAASGVTIYLSGNLTVSTTTGQILSTNVSIIMNGTGVQTWSHPGQTTGLLRTNLTISNSNTVVSGTVGYGIGILIISVPITTTNSTLHLALSCSVNVEPVTWNNITFGTTTAQTYTLLSNLYATGALTVLATNTIISGLTYAVYIGSYTSTAGTLTLTINCPLIFNGSGAISMGGNSIILTSSIVNINTTGTVTIPTGSVFLIRANATGLTFSYTSGTFLPAQGSAISISNATSNYNTIVDFPNITFWSVLIGSQASPGTITLLSDLICDGGTFTFAPNGTNAFTINGGKNIYVGKNVMANFVNSAGGGSSISGNSTFVFGGSGRSTFTSNSTTSNVQINNNITFNFNGVLTFYDPTSTSGYPGLSLGSGTYSYISGKIQSKDYSGKINNGTITINSACTLLGFNEMIGFGNVSITGGTTIIMDKFFNGSSKNILKVRSTNTTNYIISFQDTFEKLSNFTRISNCTVTNRNQLLLLSQRGNGGSNIGVRYVNQLPNSVQKSSNFSSVYPTGSSDITYLDGGLLQDPNTSSNYNY